MKKIILVLFLTLCAQLLIAQPIKVSLHPQSPTTFYEGENIQIVLVIENTTKDSLLCIKRRLGAIEKVSDIGGFEVTNGNYENFLVVKSHARTKPEEEIPRDLLPPKYKMQVNVVVDFFFKSNATLADLLPVKYTRFGYLKAGHYTLHCAIKVEGYSATFPVAIEVLKPSGDLLERFKALAKAINTTEINLPSADLVGDSTQPTIMQFLNKYKNGAYTETAVVLPSYSLAFSGSMFLDNPVYVWQLLHKLPQIYEGKEWLSYSDNFYAGMFVDNPFCRRLEPSITDKEGYINAYLQKLEKFSPSFCDKIIDHASKCCDRSKLINYARLREQREPKTKKKKP